jgi:transposase
MPMFGSLQERGNRPATSGNPCPPFARTVVAPAESAGVGAREELDPGAGPDRADPAERPGIPERATRDYKPHGTSSLYAGFDLTTGNVIGSPHNRHRAIEFNKFLIILDKEVPADLDVHLVLDNASSHKTPVIKRWLVAHPRFVLHFTPTSNSWLNLVKRWLGELTTKKHKRSAPRSAPALTEDGEARWQPLT